MFLVYKRRKLGELMCTYKDVTSNVGIYVAPWKALNLLMDDTPVVTIWEGEIVDMKDCTFYSGKWERMPEDDIRYWTKFPSFAPLLSEVEADGGKSLDLSKLSTHFYEMERAILCKCWNKQYFVNVGTDCG
ncbi:hypothetical protein SLA2020_255140 [Shorea laevis]